MRYSGIHVRTAVADDFTAVISFADQVHQLTVIRSPGGATERYRAALDDPARRVVLAEDSAGELVGMAVFMRDSAGDLLDIPVLRVGHLVVAPAHRRRGAGRALLAAAVMCADEFGVEHVLAGAGTQARDVHRYLARLGFAPIAVRRMAPVGLLRRNLGLSDSTRDHPQGRARRRVLAHVMRAPRPGATRPSGRVGV